MSIALVVVVMALCHWSLLPSERGDPPPATPDPYQSKPEKKRLPIIKP